MRKKLVVFIGDRPSHFEIQINNKPCFSDVLLLTKMFYWKNPYHTISFEQSPLSIYIKENNSQFTCNPNLLQLNEGDQPLLEEEVYDIFTSFAFIKNHKVSILVINDKKKYKCKKE
nr:hypothetical protein [Neobacillus sp. Marseille-Q6967]